MHKTYPMLVSVNAYSQHEWRYILFDIGHVFFSNCKSKLLVNFAWISRGIRNSIVIKRDDTWKVLDGIILAILCAKSIVLDNEIYGFVNHAQNFFGQSCSLNFNNPSIYRLKALAQLYRLNASNNIATNLLDTFKRDTRSRCITIEENTNETTKD